MDSRTRSALRRIAHDLKPVVMVGKEGLTAGVKKAADEALDVHELVKMKFVDYKDEKREIAEETAKDLNAELVAVTGNTALLFRRNPDPKRRVVMI
jgi:RNA-binding protein